MDPGAEVPHVQPAVGCVFEIKGGPLKEGVIGHSTDRRRQHQGCDHRVLEHGQAFPVTGQHPPLGFLVSLLVPILDPQVFQRPPNEYGHHGGGDGVDQQDVPPEHEGQKSTGHQRGQNVADVGAEAMDGYGEPAPVGETP